MRWKIWPFLLPLMANPASAEPLMYCVTRGGLACDSHSAISRAAVVVPTTGCSVVGADIPAKIIESEGYFVRIRTQAPFPEIALWIFKNDVQCAPLVPARPSSPPEPALLIDVTGDGYVWQNGRRIGYVDSAGKGPAVFYLMEQLDLSKDPPTPKPGENGKNVSREKVKQDVNELVRPKSKLELPNLTVEKTGDGFVWRGGQRVGWLDGTGSIYFRIDQVDIVGGVAKPKIGEHGEAVQGSLAEVVERQFAPSK
jgi:hypothetical protein